MEDGVVRAVLAIPSASMTEMQNVRKGPLSEQGVDEGVRRSDVPGITLGHHAHNLKAAIQTPRASLR